MGSLINTTEATIALRFEAVSKYYPVGRGRALPVFEQFSLDVERGCFLAILGASGCGKSTLLRMAAGLEPPSAGRVAVGQSSPGKAGRVVLMFQHYSNLPWLSVARNVEIGLLAQRGFGKAEARTTAQAYLDRVGLSEWKSAYPKQLSGGMQQRLALARTLAMQPDVVLLDEPLGALDALTRLDLQDLIRATRSEGNPKTYLMVTHDVDEALALADRLLVLGPPGSGTIYDSYSNEDRLDRNHLLQLLRDTNRLGLSFVPPNHNGLVGSSQDGHRDS
jgi:ABC-type nitrate/sulfonate/bicarbonate transport system ATPase subunit